MCQNLRVLMDLYTPYDIEESMPITCRQGDTLSHPFFANLMTSQNLGI